MTFFLFANNARTSLAVGLSVGDTQVTVAPGTGTLFPSPVSDVSVFRATLSDSTGQLTEIVEVTLRDGDVMTVTRGMEGTLEQPWSAGTNFRQLLTKGQCENFRQISGVGPIFYPSRQVVTDNDLTILPTDVVLLVNRTEASEFILPAPSSLGRVLIFKDFAGNSETYPITLDAGFGKLINGQRTLVMEANYSTTWLNGMSSTKWGTFI